MKPLKKGNLAAPWNCKQDKIISDAWITTEEVLVNQILSFLNNENNINVNSIGIQEHQTVIETDSANSDLSFLEELNDNNVIFNHEFEGLKDYSPSQFDVNNFVSKLCDWSSSSNISHLAINSLLNILKEVPDLKDLPKDARTLLKTPRTSNMEILGSGTYSYLGIKQGILDVLQFEDDIPSTIQLLLNIDGVPISKSSGGQFWPQLGKIRNLTSSKVFPIGICHGTEKPQDPNKYMSKLIEELNCLINQGFQIRNKTVNMEHVGFVCDAPAKAFLLRTKGHNGYFSCTRCRAVERICGPLCNLPPRAPPPLPLKYIQVI